MRWMAEYERGWRAGDRPAVNTSFTDETRHRTSPYDEPKVGHTAVQAFWLEDDLVRFTVDAEPVAIAGRDAVVRLEVPYGGPRRRQYRDLLGLRFADDGRGDEFTEWTHRPGRSYTAQAES